MAVSGGPDSVALLRAMATIKRETGGAGRLIVAHLNHHLRPEADDDARFVAELAQGLELPYERGDAAVAKLAADQGDGIEASARRSALSVFTANGSKIRCALCGNSAHGRRSNRNGAAECHSRHGIVGIGRHATRPITGTIGVIDSAHSPGPS